eukprot:CAMPEP_0181206754 /NCGR_PEP_ID=MMETSP1096-20121128/21207_1 /TAXON_ID=156174 ORGANISM="Chrysochromulina ericina, Strain CCMP281" /NCGR_SAMPLE_ID=MMETSP1096 /ASSEMBLY_ACC=CAM_ASM_000453 /LENGTH=81 /DNA_ID=CAMNT_0023297681 /DNA_START=490 /DNA_END=735 /DNA_ORIENTATION=-
MSRGAGVLVELHVLATPEHAPRKLRRLRRGPYELSRRLACVQLTLRAAHGPRPLPLGTQRRITAEPSGDLRDLRQLTARSL